MQTFYAVVMSGVPEPVVVVCNKMPLRFGIFNHQRAYIVRCFDREDAKALARERFRRGDETDGLAWAM